MLFHDALKSIPGITIFTFTEPRFALEHFKTNISKYFLVISDLKMPVLDGMELLKKIKDLNSSVRTILMTAFAFDDKLFKEYAKSKIIKCLSSKANSSR